MPLNLSVHPQRYALTNELHARPFQPMTAPGRVMFLAFKRADGAAERDPARDRAHLIEFCDRHGAPHPAPDANHFYHDFGRFRLKWERHTEFVSYTLYEETPAEDLFSTDLADILPDDWLADAPGQVIAAIQVEAMETESAEETEKLLRGRLAREFNAESLAVARVLDGNATALGDFRIHEGGFSRFALVLHGPSGPRRIGRLIQRLIEVETYRTLAMTTLPLARETAAKLNEIETELTKLIDQVAHDEANANEAAILAQLTELSADLESLSAGTAFRFGAQRAYEALVHQRIDSLREERLKGRQLFREFMMRRFDPAMRTCQAAERRLGELSLRASRIADLLRTRVDVGMQAQNQRLLESMDRRAELQVRLQKTVEGLSAVAISYYAVSLASYLLSPFAPAVGLDKTGLTAAIAIPVILAVWVFVRRVRRQLEKSDAA
jgi:uncharacterized membrane-anchored protein